METIAYLVEIAISEWQPAWLILCGIFVAVLVGVYRLVLLFAGLFRQTLLLQKQDIEVKQKLLVALRVLRKTIDKALSELER